MAPSRGKVVSNAKVNDGDEAVQQQSNSALTSARRNLGYLISPNNPNQPRRFRTRALLRTVRYVGQFVIWRLVRWAKYIAVGALATAVGATAIGSMVTGVAWVVAPTSIGASIMAAGVWGVGKFAAHRLHARWKKDGGEIGEKSRERLEDEAGNVRGEGAYGVDVGPRAVPW